MTTRVTHGDAELGRRVGERLGPRHSVIATAYVSAAGRRAATVDAPIESDFEIGSVSKGLTGLLYADAMDRGEVAASTTLGELLDLRDSPAGGVTLGSLSTHTSGLPRLPHGSHGLRRTLDLWRGGTNPYGESLAELLAQTRATPVGKKRKPSYSNLGFELLGHALAAAAGTTYATLLADRITGPLGMAGTYVPVSPADLRQSAIAGRSRSGRPREPWTGEALGPAGGIRSTAGDLGILLVALLDGSAPGVAALDPVQAFAGRAVRIGAAWLTLPFRDKTITWHNGGTGGFRSWVGLDREASTGLAIVSAVASSVDHHGFTLLSELTAEEA